MATTEGRQEMIDIENRIYTAERRIEKLTAYNTQLKIEKAAYKSTLKSIRTYCKNNMDGQMIGPYRMLFAEIENCFVHTDDKIKTILKVGCE